MKCPKCNAIVSKVRETRSIDDSIYRYRDCMGCGNAFKTKESIFTGKIERKREEAPKPLRSVWAGL